MTGTIWGVGLGPGDPDLMSVKAHRLVTTARHVAYFRKAGRPGQARRLVGDLMPAEAVELAMEYPVKTEIPLEDPRYAACLSAFYEESVTRLLEVTRTGADVVVLCEGDPFFYGSFMHLHSRLAGKANVEVVPAITGMSAAWTATGQPVTWGDDILTVLMGTLPGDALSRAMAASDAIVVMKIGQHLGKVRTALCEAGKLGAAWLIEYAAMPEERVRPLAEVTDDVAPYFAIVVVHGQGRRP